MSEASVHGQQTSVLTTTEKVQNLTSPSQLDSEICKKIQERVRTPANESGYIYIFKNPEVPPDEHGRLLLKIGVTKTKIKTRMRQLVRRCNHSRLQQVEDPEQWHVPFYRRVEDLVHKELQNLQRNVMCTSCCLRHQDRILERRDRGFGVQHGEWFYITEDAALQSVQRWRRYVINAYNLQGALHPHYKAALEEYPRAGENEGVEDHQSRHERLLQFIAPSAFLQARMHLKALQRYIEGREKEPGPVVQYVRSVGHLFCLSFVPCFLLYPRTFSSLLVACAVAVLGWQWA